MTNNHLEEITQVLCKFFNSLSKQKHAIYKPHNLRLQSYAAKVVKFNKNISFFIGSYKPNNIEEEKMKKIIFHSLPNGWYKQAYI